VGCALGDEELDALDPADGAGDLLDEGFAGGCAGGDDRSADVGGYRDSSKIILTTGG
jgi:hypothetical protein